MKSIYQKNKAKHRQLPNRTWAGEWTESIFSWLFSLDDSYLDELIHQEREQELKNKLKDLLEKVLDDADTIHTSVTHFFDSINGIHSQLEEDLQAIVNFDPAAKSENEVIVSYPGFFAIAIYRLAHQLWINNVPVLPRLISEYVHGKTGIDIHPGATIGRQFLIDHGTGVVIGETAEIGDNVKIYQGVTLGALAVSKETAEIKRHPSIGNNVVIYANATILGGNTHIGNDSVIGGNVWITNSIPSNSLVYHKSEIVIKDKITFPEPLNYVI